MNFRIPIAAAIVGFSAAIVPGSVSTEVIVFSNFGPGDSFDQSQFWGINGPTSSFQPAVALPFSPSNTTELSRAEFAAEHFGNDPSITFTVFADNSGEPGSLLDKITLGSFTDGIVSADFSGGAVLMAGNTY